MATDELYMASEAYRSEHNYCMPAPLPVSNICVRYDYEREMSPPPLSNCIAGDPSAQNTNWKIRHLKQHCIETSSAQFPFTSIVDVKNFIDDMLELDKLSPVHRCEIIAAHSKYAHSLLQWNSHENVGHIVTNTKDFQRACDTFAKYYYTSSTDSENPPEHVITSRITYGDKISAMRNTLCHKVNGNNTNVLNLIDFLMRKAKENPHRNGTVLTDNVKLRKSHRISSRKSVVKIPAPPPVQIDEHQENNEKNEEEFARTRLQSLDTVLEMPLVKCFDPIESSPESNLTCSFHIAKKTTTQCQDIGEFCRKRLQSPGSDDVNSNSDKELIDSQLESSAMSKKRHYINGSLLEDESSEPKVYLNGTVHSSTNVEEENHTSPLVEHDYYCGDESDASSTTSSSTNSSHSSVNSPQQRQYDNIEDIDVVPLSPSSCLQALPLLNGNDCEKIATDRLLHYSLMTSKRHVHNIRLLNRTNPIEDEILRRQMAHSIRIEVDDKVLNAFYVDYHLVIAQTRQISFWTQSALGNLLCAQNMWIPNGNIERLVFCGDKYVQKPSSSMVCSVRNTNNNVLYVELWMKEHSSEMRERPVADVFVGVYFWRSELNRKVLQLENLQALSQDVQYLVLTYTPRIIVSWWSTQGNNRMTNICSYRLAADYQTVESFQRIQTVNHYVSMLCNIQECENLILGCGDNKVTLWNIDYGNTVATIHLNEIPTPVLWCKCDRGFLFTIHKAQNTEELMLIAINGRTHLWKKLQSFEPSTEYKNLRGVCIDSGILTAHYREGIICWNMQNGEKIVEEVPMDHSHYLQCGQYVLIVTNGIVMLEHTLNYIITSDSS